MSAKGLVRERIWQLLEQKLLASDLALVPTEGPSKPGSTGQNPPPLCRPLFNGP